MRVRVVGCECDSAVEVLLGFPVALVMNIDQVEVQPGEPDGVGLRGSSFQGWTGCGPVVLLDGEVAFVCKRLGVSGIEFEFRLELGLRVSEVAPLPEQIAETEVEVRGIGCDSLGGAESRDGACAVTFCVQGFSRNHVGLGGVGILPQDELVLLQPPPKPICGRRFRALLPGK